MHKFKSDLPFITLDLKLPHAVLAELFQNIILLKTSFRALSRTNDTLFFMVNSAESVLVLQGNKLFVAVIIRLYYLYIFSLVIF